MASTGSAAEVAARIERDGFAVLEDRLPIPTCDALTLLAQTLEARSIDGGAVTVVDPTHLSAPRYDLDERDLLADPHVQQLVVDPSLHEIATIYLGGEAVSDAATMWWSLAQPAGPSSAAAQKFHTDRDRLSFLKFFVYLTDVDDDRGPHVYVRGSHRHLPAAMRPDRRYEDDEVVAACGQSSITPILGPRGTIFAADTSGLHKGLPPRTGHRLVFELEYATNLFGAPVVRCDPSTLHPTHLAVARMRPWAYDRLLDA